LQLFEFSFPAGKSFSNATGKFQLKLFLGALYAVIEVSPPDNRWQQALVVKNYFDLTGGI